MRRSDEILVFEVPDPVKHVTGWRLPGGTIEFGERGRETVVREIREELDSRSSDASYLELGEHLHYLGRSGHDSSESTRPASRNHGFTITARFDCVEANGALIHLYLRSLTRGLPCA